MRAGNSATHAGNSVMHAGHFLMQNMCAENCWWQFEVSIWGGYLRWQCELEGVLDDSATCCVWVQTTDECDTSGEGNLWRFVTELLAGCMCVCVCVCAVQWQVQSKLCRDAYNCSIEAAPPSVHDNNWAWVLMVVHVRDMKCERGWWCMWVMWSVRGDGGACEWCEVWKAMEVHVSDVKCERGWRCVWVMWFVGVDGGACEWCKVWKAMGVHVSDVVCERVVN